MFRQDGSVKWPSARGGSRGPLGRWRQPRVESSPPQPSPSSSSGQPCSRSGRRRHRCRSAEVGECDSGLGGDEPTMESTARETDRPARDWRGSEIPEDEQGTKILGTPLGHPACVRRFLSQLSEKHNMPKHHLHTQREVLSTHQLVRLVAIRDRFVRCLFAPRGSKIEFATCPTLAERTSRPLSQRNGHCVFGLQAGPGRFARQTPLEKLLACTEINLLTVEHLLWQHAARLGFVLRLHKQGCSPKVLHNVGVGCPVPHSQVAQSASKVLAGHSASFVEQEFDAP